MMNKLALYKRPIQRLKAAPAIDGRSRDRDARVKIYQSFTQSQIMTFP